MIDKEGDVGVQFNYRIKYNYLLIGIGFIFLINGNINIFDPLPDFLGYILIALGIGHLFLLSEHYNTARKTAFYLILVASAKFAVSFFTKNFNDYDFLLITAAFNIIELILALQLFGSLSKANALYFELNDSYDDSRDTAFYGGFLKIFLCVKYLSAVIAQMPVIINQDFIDRLAFNRNIFIDLHELKNTAVLISVIITSLFGIFMLTVIPPHFYKLYKNEAVNDKLRVMILSAEGGYLKIKLQNYGVVFLLLSVSVIFLFDIAIDGIIIPPDFISAGALLTAVINLKNFYEPGKYRKAAAAAFALSLITASSFAFNIYALSTEADRVFSGGGEQAAIPVAVSLTLLSNALFAFIYIFIFKSADKLRLEEIHLARKSSSFYVPQSELEKKTGGKAVNIFIAAAFLIKSAQLLDIEHPAFLIPYFFVCITCVIFSIYKLNRINKSIKYYYQAGDSHDKDG